MRFLFPLGFLALLAVPVLIIIYIIKSKYTEQVISSTYLWTLSERFLKRKNPIQRITGILSLILQILAVIFIAIAIAHPVFTLKGRADDYCFVLDGSGSMNFVQDGETRFETGKNRIKEIINSASDGSTFTLITTGNTTDMVVKQSEDKKATIRQIDALKPSCASSDFGNARLLAENFFADNPASSVYLVTDKQVQSLTNAQLINVAKTSVNRGLSEVSYVYTVDGDVIVTGTVYSYDADAAVTVEAFADESQTAVASAQLDLTANEGKDFTLNWAAAEGAVNEFATLRVEIAEEDDLALDDGVTLYNVRSDSQYTSLIVSDTPRFIVAALASKGNMRREVISPKEYDKTMRGYGLYVFENYTPSEMPEDGAVWFINPDTGVDGTSGFSHRGKTELAGPTDLQLNASSSTRVKNLLRGTSAGSKTGIVSYVKCGLYRNFTTLMYCNGDPVVFAGTNSYGNREVVFAVDWHASDFALSYNGRIVVYNLIDYTFPLLVDETSFYCGEAVGVNVLANCTGIRVDTPSGKAEYLQTSSAVSEYELTEVGEYVITATIGNNRQVARVYSQLPVAERITGATEADFTIVGEPSANKRDGKYEDLLYAFIILAVIVVADWMVYCYEQYQLR